MKFRQRHSPGPVLRKWTPPDPAQPAGEELPETQSPTQTKRSLKSRLFRFTTRSAVGAILLVALLLTALLLLPLPLGPFDASVRRAVERGTGLRFGYTQARIRVADGSVEFTAPRLLDAQNGAPLLELARLRIETPFNQYMLGERPYTIQNIELEGPLTLTLAMERGRPQLVGPAARLFAQLAEHLRGQMHGGPPGVELRRVAISPVNIELWDQIPEAMQAETTATAVQAGADAVRPAEQVVTLRDAELEARFSDSLEPQLVSISTSAGTRLVLRPDLPLQRVDYTLRFENFTSAQLPWEVPVRVRASQLDASGRAGWKEIADGARKVDWETTGRLALTGASVAQDIDSAAHELGDLVFNWNVAGPGRGENILLRGLNLESRDMVLATSGTLERETPFAYNLRINELLLRGEGAALAAEPFVRRARLLDPQSARVRLSASASGELKRLRPGELRGRVEFSHLDLASPNLPEPLRDLRGEGELTSSALRLTKVQAQYANLPLELEVIARGRPLRGRIEEYELAWRTAGPLAGLNSTLARLLPREFTLEGNASTEGRIRIPGPLRGEMLHQFEQAKLDGRFEFQNVTLRHPDLPTPLRKLNGRLEFDRDAVRAVDLRGSVGQLDWRIDGQALGKPVFWRDARVMGSAATDFKFDELPKLAGELTMLLPREQGARLNELIAQLPATSGAGELRFNANGPLAPAGGLAWNTEVRARQVRTALRLSTRTLPLQLDTLNLAADAREWKIENTRGKMGGLDFELSALLAPGGGELTLRTRGGLPEYMTWIPFAQKRFIVSGGLEVNHKTRYEAIEPPAPGITFYDYIRQLRADGSRLDATSMTATRVGPWRTRHEGTLTLKDAEFTYYAMPAWLRHISTTMRYDELHMWSPEAFEIDGGANQRKLRTTLDVIYPPRRGEATQLNFHVTGEHFALRDWLKPWNFKYRRRTTPWPDDTAYDPNQKPYFKLRGTFDVQSAELHNLQTGPMTGRLDVDTYMDQPDRLEWRELKGELYGGQFTCDGFSYNRRFEMRATGEGVGVPELKAALLPDSQGTGVYSGRITGELALRRLLGRDPPEPLLGEAKMQIEKSRFVSNKIFGGLGGVLNLPLFEDITFSTIRGPVRIEGEKYSTEKLIFENPVLNLEASGSLGPNRKLDGRVRLQFLSIAGGVPIVSQALGLINSLAGQIFQVYLRGTTDNPEYRLF